MRSQPPLPWPLSISNLNYPPRYSAQCPPESSISIINLPQAAKIAARKKTATSGTPRSLRKLNSIFSLNRSGTGGSCIHMDRSQRASGGREIDTFERIRRTDNIFGRRWEKDGASERESAAGCTRQPLARARTKTRNPSVSRPAGRTIPESQNVRYKADSESAAQGFSGRARSSGLYGAFTRA